MSSVSQEICSRKIRKHIGRREWFDIQYVASATEITGQY